MARASRYETAERELAYRVWCQAEGNMAEALRRLDTEHEWPLARQTLFDWRDQYGWEARRAADLAEAKRRARSDSLDRSAMLASLDLQIERYEGAFAAAAAAGEPPDARAMGAYANLLRLRLSTLRDIEGGAGVDRLELAMEVLREIGDLVRQDYPQHAPAWLELLEPAGARLAEHFGG